MAKEVKNVFFVGLKNIHEKDQIKIKNIIYKDFQLLERELKKIKSLKLSFKCYQNGGRKKYSANLLIDLPGRPITVNNMVKKAEWDPIMITHQLLARARKEIMHIYKTR